MAEVWKHRMVPGFEGGINTDRSPDNLLPNQHLILKNMDVDSERRASVRAGTVRITSGPLVDANNSVASMHRFYESDGTKHFLGQSETKTFSIDPDTGVATQLATGLPAEAMRWLTYGNKAYSFNSDGTDTGYHSYDGTTWTSNISGGAIPAKGFTMGAIHEDKLFTAGDADNPSRLYFSNAYDPETFSVGDFLRLRDNDGDQIRGLCPVAGGYLLVLKDTSSWLIKGSDELSFQKQLVNDHVGLLGDTLQAIDGRPIWLSHLGVNWYNPFSAIEPFRNITRDKINTELLAHPRSVLEAAVGRFHPQGNRYLLSLPTASTPITYVFHLDVVARTQDGRPFKTFPVTTYQGVAVSSICSFDGAGDSGDMYWGETGGHIRRCDTDLHTDDGSAIEAQVKTGFLDFDLPDLRKRIGRCTIPIDVSGDPDSSVTVKLHLDWESSKSVTESALVGQDVLIWGSGLWGVKKWGPSSFTSNVRFFFHKAVANKVAVNITKSSQGSFKVHPFSIRFLPLGDITWVEQS